MFNEGRENLHDEARSCCPSLVNDDLVRKVKERARDDRRFTISDPSLHFLQGKCIVRGRNWTLYISESNFMIRN